MVGTARRRKEAMSYRRYYKLQLAELIHDLLDFPNDGHGNPVIGLKVVNAILTAIAGSLHRGEDVEIRGFGIFRIHTRKPKRTGNNFLLNRPNIHSSAPITWPSKKYVRFYPAAQLRALINPTGTNRVERRALSITSQR